MKIKPLNPAIASAALLAIGALQAKAATIVDYSLSSFNVSGYTGPFGNVEVNLTSSTQATITFTGLNGYLFVDGSSAAINVNASSFGASLLSDPEFDHFSSGDNVDGWGTFNLVLNNGNASVGVGTISFSLVNNSGNWADAANVLGLNNKGNLVAAHIITPDGNKTGYASGNVAVPDGGSTVALLGCGLAGLGMISRKFRKN